ncbi:MAG: sulfite exporter TauE/SafE family protein [Chloroflexi bacterium]|nr:sulfite exporter TauE/SafE family protein [Chloroflexota bacterium]
MDTLLIGTVIGFVIGGALGLLGGGGSILTVPALVYLVGQTPQVAVTTSLAIVGANSALGAYFHRAEGSLNWRVALVFGGVGMITSFMAAGVSKSVSPDLLMVAFALLMLLIGGLLTFAGSAMMKRGNTDQFQAWKVIAGGAGVGLLTGILGVGGGFLIVPALVMLVGLPMHHAVGTSLVVIAMNSAAGFLGHMSSLALDLPLISVFVAAGIAGTFAGVRLGKRLEANMLRRAFAVFVIVLAVFLLIDNLPKIGIIL